MVNPTGPKLSVRIESWPIAGQFTISRGAKTEAKVVVAELSDGGFPNRVSGRGECIPYARYGESTEAVAALLEGLVEKVAQGWTRDDSCKRRCPPVPPATRSIALSGTWKPSRPESRFTSSRGCPLRMR